MFLLYLVAKDKKMMNKKNIIIGSVVGLLALVGYYVYRQGKLLSLLCYDFLSVDFLGRQNNNSQLALNFGFTNYSNVPIEITQYNINAYINDNMVGRLAKAENFVIPAKQTSTVQFVAETDTSLAFSQVLNSFLTQFIDKTTSKFKIKGVASVKMGIVRVNDYPLEWEWTTEEIMLNLKSGGKCPPIT